MNDLLIDSTVRIVFGCIGTAANIAQIFFIIKKKHAKRPFEATLLSLSSADLITSGTLVTFGIYDILLAKGIVSLTKFIEIMNEAALDLSIITSLVHVIYIAIQRLLAVLSPIKFQLSFTKFRCSVGLIFIWILSSVYCTWSSLEKRKGTPTFYILSLTIVVCSILLSISYFIICWKVMTSRTYPRTRGGVEAKVLCNSMLVGSAFVICTIPFTLKHLKVYEPANFYQFIIPLWLLFLNVVLDPFIYFLFKYANISLQTCLCPFAKRSSEQRRQTHNMLLSRRSSKQATRQTTTEL